MRDAPCRYELWDRYSGNMVMDFADWDEALAFVRGEIQGCAGSQ